MNDTTRRFFDALLERVNEEKIVEIRLFPPIRQGGVESGVAVLAVEPVGEPEDEFGPPAIVVGESGEILADSHGQVAVDVVAEATQELPADDVHEAATREIPVPLESIVGDLIRDEGEAPDLGDFLYAEAEQVEEVTDQPERLAILCASYKLTVKGVDRGKWEVEIVHHADAPLGTLDNVIRGVVRRSGDDAEPERFTRQSLRDFLDAPSWVSEA